MDAVLVAARVVAVPVAVAAVQVSPNKHIVGLFN